MKRFLLPLAAFAITGLLLPTGVQPAYACSCAILSPQEYVDNADVIVIGTVVRMINTTEQFPSVDEKSDGIIADVDAVVAVERYLKGTGPIEIAVDDPPSGGACGFISERSLDQRYLLFLSGQARSFKTHLCSGSTDLAGIYRVEQQEHQFLQEVEAITGPGIPPTDATALPEQTRGDSFPWLPIIITSSLGGAALAASALLLRRRVTRR